MTKGNYDEFYEGILTEAFYPIAEKVMLIKDFLDKHFKRSYAEDVNSEGYPVDEPQFIMYNRRKVPVMSLGIDDVVLYLEDQNIFRNMVSNKEDRRKFFREVAKEWFNRTISHNGVLSRNSIV